MTSRYIANNTDAHIQANRDLAKKIMSFIKAPGQGNATESKGTGCKTETKVVADGKAGDTARKGKTDGNNGTDCDYAI